jgi:hypothetical protein
MTLSRLTLPCRDRVHRLEIEQRLCELHLDNSYCLKKNHLDFVVLHGYASEWLIDGKQTRAPRFVALPNLLQ